MPRRDTDALVNIAQFINTQKKIKELGQLRRP
jgi:hypothetical protein